MRKIILGIALSLLVTTSVIAQDLGAPPKYPDHIEYKAADATEEAAATSSIQELLKGELKLSLPTVLGPFLRDRLSIDDINNIPSTFVVPRIAGNIEGLGATFGEPEDLTKLSAVLAAQIPNPVVFRRVSPSEMEYYWAIAPFDIEGTLLITESAGRSVLWNFHPEGLLILEDVTAAKGELTESYDALLKLPQTTLEADPLPDFVTPLLQGQEVPEIFQDADKTDTPLIVFITPDRVVDYRVEADALITYIGQFKTRLQAELRSGSSQKLFVQFDLVPGQAARLFLGAQPALKSEAITKLQADLEAIPLPEIRGPIRLLLVELPETEG